MLGWVCGDRSDATVKKLIEKVDDGKCTFVTDDFAGFHRLIPEDRLFTGKDLTYPIEQTNSDVRNQAARFIRRHKASSRSLDMVQATLKIVNLFRNPDAVREFMQPLLTFFS